MILCKKRNYQLLQMQFDYAWKWFAYHAEQRIRMFDYFLIIIGILANAYIQAYIYFYAKNHFSIVNYLIGSIGVVVSIAFILLDVRNRQLVEIGEKYLKILEKEDIFSNFYQSEKGILHNKDENIKHKPLISHTILIRFVESAVLLLFISSIVILSLKIQ